MGCACERGARSGTTLQTTFARFWPAGTPFPPLAPWLRGVLSRQTAAGLIEGPQGSALRENLRLVEGDNRRPDGIADSDDTCSPEQGFCSISAFLPQMAQDWYEDALGRIVVVMLYELLAIEFCNSCAATVDEYKNCSYLNMVSPMGWSTIRIGLVGFIYSSVAVISTRMGETSPQMIHLIQGKPSDRCPGAHRRVAVPLGRLRCVRRCTGWRLGTPAGHGSR